MIKQSLFFVFVAVSLCVSPICLFPLSVFLLSLSLHCLPLSPVRHSPLSVSVHRPIRPVCPDRLSFHRSAPRTVAGCRACVSRASPWVGTVPPASRLTSASVTTAAATRSAPAPHEDLPAPASPARWVLGRGADRSFRGTERLLKDAADGVLKDVYTVHWCRGISFSVVFQRPRRRVKGL